MRIEELVKRVNGNGKIDRKFKNVIAYSPLIAQKIKSPDATIFLSQLLYWTGKQADPEGWIYKTIGEIYRETGLTRWKQDKAKKILTQMGILAIKRKGIPAKLHFRINLDVLYGIITDNNGTAKECGNAENPQVSLLETSKQDCWKTADKIAGNQQTSLLENNKQDCWKTADKIAGNQQTSLLENNKQVCGDTTNYKIHNNTTESTQNNTTYITSDNGDEKKLNKNGDLFMEDLIKKYYEKYVELKQKHFKSIEDTIDVYLNSEFLTMFRQKYGAHRELFMNFDETLKLVERTYVFLFGEVNFYWIIKNIDKIKLEKIMTPQNPIFTTYMSMIKMIEGVDGDYFKIKKEYFKEFWKEFMFWIFGFNSRAMRFNYIDYKMDASNEILLVGRNILSYDYIKSLIEIKSRTEE